MILADRHEALGNAKPEQLAMSLTPILLAPLILLAQVDADSENPLGWTANVQPPVRYFFGMVR